MINLIEKFKLILFVKGDEDRSLYRYRNIILTGSTAAMVKIFTSLIGLVTVPLTVNYLGSERYGVWMTMSSFLALMSFADMGLGNGLVNSIAKAFGANNKKMALKAISSTFVLLSTISIILLLVFNTIYPHVSWHKIFNAQSEIAVAESGPAIYVFTIIFFINLPLGIIRRIQDGYQEGYKFQRIMVIGSLFSLSGLLLCIKMEGGLPYLVMAFLGGNLMATLINGAILFGYQRRDLLPNLTSVDIKFGISLIKTGFIFFLLQVFTLVGNSSDNIIIAHFIGPSSVAEYEIVKKLFFLTMLTQFIIQPLWPAFGEAMVSGDYKWAQSTLQKAIKIGSISSALLALPMLIFGKTIISVWVGEEFVPSWSLMTGFYFFIIFANYGGVMSTFLNSGPLLKKQLLIIGLSSVSSVILKIILSNTLGVSGIIWATTISYSIFYLIPSYRIAFNHLRKMRN